MNIISHSTSINSLIVSSKDLELISFANNKLLDDRKQVSRIIGRPITNFARRMTPGWIKVSQRDELTIWSRFSEGFDHQLHTQFRFAIWTDGLAFKFLRTIILFTINSSSGREKEMFAFFKLLHHFEEI